MSAAICPECETEIKSNDPVKVGERIFCPECDIELEVISVKPLILDYAFDDEYEEWEEGWEEE